MAGEDEGQRQQREEKRRKGIIQIPSYDEVLNSDPKTTTSYNMPAPSPAAPPSSFSQAFSFIKSSEFYTPPAHHPPQSTAQPRPVAEPQHASTSSTVQSRNAILVSHRQKGNPLLKHIRNVRWTFADIVCDYLFGQSSCAIYISLRYHLLHPDYLYYRIRELQKNFKLRVVLCHVDVSLSRIMDASMEDLARCPGIGERKVRRLHDTFHEPFRRVSSRPSAAAPETLQRAIMLKNRLQWTVTLQSMEMIAS